MVSILSAFNCQKYEDGEDNSGSSSLIHKINQTVLISKSRKKLACVQPTYSAKRMMAAWFYTNGAHIVLFSRLPCLSTPLASCLFPWFALGMIEQDLNLCSFVSKCLNNM